MKIDIVKATPPNKLNPTDVSQHVPLSETYVGLGTTAILFTKLLAGQPKKMLICF